MGAKKSVKKNEPVQMSDDVLDAMFRISKVRFEEDNLKVFTDSVDNIVVLESESENNKVPDIIRCVLDSFTDKTFTLMHLKGESKYSLTINL